MKFKCPYCGEVVPNASMRRVTCGKEECMNTFRNEYNKVYRKEPGYKEKKKEYQRKYHQKPKNKESMRMWKRTYLQAFSKLRDNHREEFDKILIEFRRRYKK